MMNSGQGISFGIARSFHDPRGVTGYETITSGRTVQGFEEPGEGDDEHHRRLLFVVPAPPLPCVNVIGLFLQAIVNPNGYQHEP